MIPAQAQNVAPALVGAALELEKAMKKDKLRSAIAERPTKDKVCAWEVIMCSGQVAFSSPHWLL